MTAWRAKVCRTLLAWCCWSSWPRGKAANYEWCQNRPHIPLTPSVSFRCCFGPFLSSLLSLSFSSRGQGGRLRVLLFGKLEEVRNPVFFDLLCGLVVQHPELPSILQKSFQDRRLIRELTSILILHVGIWVPASLPGPPDFRFSKVAAGEFVIYDCCCNALSILPAEFVLGHPSLDPAPDCPCGARDIQVDTAAGPNFSRGEPRLI